MLSMPSKRTCFALMDCNNFYASCERVFNPKLMKKPVAVLSNNDGCIIARSNELKQAGIPMGAPVFKHKETLAALGAHICSSNFELYGDMSKRVMQCLKNQVPDVEIYSIDEAFMNLSTFPTDQRFSMMMQLQKQINQWVGIPVSIGIGPTKTLAKVANYMAKRSSANVVDLSNPKWREKVFETYPIEEVWGIAKGLRIKLNLMNIYTVKQLLDCPPAALRNKFGVVVSRIQAELSGLSCLEEQFPPDKKSIMTSRSFTKAVTRPDQLQEGLSCFAARGAEKMRGADLEAGGLYLFWRGSKYAHTKIWGRAPLKSTYAEIYIPFPTSTNNTAYILKMIRTHLNRYNLSNLSVKRAGALFVGLTKASHHQLSLNLFAKALTTKKDISPALDKINQRFGKDRVFFGAQGLKRSPVLSSRTNCSPRYTTRWEELLQVR